MSSKKKTEIERDRTAAGATGIDAKRGASPLWVYPEAITIIGRDTPHKSREEHVLWQERALGKPDPALVRSMKEKGFLDTVEVRKNGPLFELVAGRRRTIAAREANRQLVEEGRDKLRVELKVISGTDREMHARMIEENSHREDVHAIHMADDLYNHMARYGANEKEAADVYGQTVQQLRELLKLRNLHEKLRAACVAGKLPVTAAIDLTDLTRDEQLVRYERIMQRVEAGEIKPTVKEIKGEVEAAKRGEDESTVVPGKRLLMKVLADEDAMAVLGPQGIAALEWAMGNRNARTIKGLSGIVKRVQTKKSS